ncbi:MAG: AmmeMemoRadiSam system radical SAM enzyme [Candidatus Omnitrophica bacterium]|nr:AmmeMemoRadiSam system radical SAM enzyme [Candidatus Omnitrophota bacterium]
MHPAQWWQSACAGVQCTLCPFNCFIPEGMRGICNVRANVAGELKTLVYAQPVSLHVDPIEKKPFYHLYPGSRAFSVSTVGCNLNCAFCQNWEISQVQPEQAKGEYVPPAKLVEMAQRAGCRSIAYTYGEPTVFYEYMLETAKLARRAGLANVMVSAGYINWPPLRELLPYLDAVKIDLKGFNEGFYRRVVKGELRYVLRTLRKLSRAGMLTELVNLVVPTLNDNMDEIRQMCRWVVQNMGPDTPLSFSRFTPHYQLQNLPPTPVETLERAYAVGRQEGLNYVYVGNVVGHPTESTFCPTCNRVMIKRYGYAVQGIFMDAEGRCPYDGTKIYGKWG